MLHRTYHLAQHDAVEMPRGLGSFITLARPIPLLLCPPRTQRDYPILFPQHLEDFTVRYRVLFRAPSLRFLNTREILHGRGSMGHGQ